MERLLNKKRGDITIQEIFEIIKGKKIVYMDMSSTDRVVESYSIPLDEQEVNEYVPEEEGQFTLFDKLFEYALEHVYYNGIRLSDFLVDSSNYLNYFHFHNDVIEFYPTVAIMIEEIDQVVHLPFER